MTKEGELAIALIQLGMTPVEAARVCAHPTATASLAIDNSDVAKIAAELNANPPAESDPTIFDQIRARAREREVQNKPTTAAERMGIVRR